MLIINFNNSQSKNYFDVHAIAIQLPVFSSSTKMKPNSITVDDSNIPHYLSILFELAGIIQNWSSLDVEFNGKKVKLYHFLHLQRQILECSKECDSKYIKSHHCWENDYNCGWGCKFIDKPFRHLNGTAFYRIKKYWYNFGKFVDENTWEIDKAELLNIITQEIEDKNLKVCPHFSMDVVRSRINSLPDQINLDSPYWEKFYRQEIGEGGLPYRVPINIRHITLDNQYSTDGKMDVILGRIKMDEKRKRPVEVQERLPIKLRDENREINLN